jgi:hypothetical protein
MSFNVDEDTFEYTSKVENVDSEVISSLYFDNSSQELVVVIASQSPWGEDQAYLYYDVSASEYDNFVRAASKGRFYNSYIKGVKQSSHLDDAEDYDFVEKAPAYTALRTVTQPEATGDFTPKGLSERTPLRVVKDEGNVFEVQFYIGTHQDLKTYSVTEPDLVSAAKAVLELGTIMGVEVRLVGVNLLGD